MIYVCIIDSGILFIANAAYLLLDLGLRSFAEVTGGHRRGEYS